MQRFFNVVAVAFGAAAFVAFGFGLDSAVAHGEDKPGPNGGFIRMPGAFHTEVILTDPSSLKVYLLDLHWKNPSVKNSSLSVTHKESKTKKTCTVESNYYVCQFPKSVDLKKKGELIVEAQRESQKGMVVSYELPLTLKVPKSGQDDHSGHGPHHGH